MLEDQGLQILAIFGFLMCSCCFFLVFVLRISRFNADDRNPTFFEVPDVTFALRHSDFLAAHCFVVISTRPDRPKWWPYRHLVDPRNCYTQTSLLQHVDDPR